MAPPWKFCVYLPCSLHQQYAVSFTIDSQASCMRCLAFLLGL